MPTTILVVDNDPVYCAQVQEYLTCLGYQVLSAADADEAQRLLSTRLVAVVLVDLRLTAEENDHDISGLLLAEAAASQFAATIILVTKHANVDTARRALRPNRGQRAVAADYVVKADGLPALAEAIERVLFRAKVFLCYARPDYEAAAQLYQHLTELGYVPWMDTPDLRAGKVWEATIRSEINLADCCVVLTSRRALNHRGFYHYEIRLALRVLEEHPQGEIYLITARLDDSPLPNDGLAKLHWVDLYEPAGLPHLAASIRACMEQKHARGPVDVP